MSTLDVPQPLSVPNVRAGAKPALTKTNNEKVNPMKTILLAALLTITATAHADSFDYQSMQNAINAQSRFDQQLAQQRSFQRQQLNYQQQLMAQQWQQTQALQNQQYQQQQNYGGYNYNYGGYGQ
jgi:hypothetical protein